jgi:hypothetical protein
VILNCLVWLLLLVCVAVLAVMLVWWGGFGAVATAIDTGEGPAVAPRTDRPLGSSACGQPRSHACAWEITPQQPPAALLAAPEDAARAPPLPLPARNPQA